ncbi:MAG TPA: amidohydrolase family protein [Syntrophorhabdales bacterium]|nr:amidohydrolase family protein [Syntrophorhabdales bacterium]
MKKENKNKKPEGMDRRSFLKGMALGAGAALVLPATASAQSGTRPVQEGSEEKIDMFCHVLPKKYKEELFKKSKPCYYLEADRNKPALFDLDMRFKDMDKFPGMRQVLTLGAPPLEYALSPTDAVELARMANDGMAELVEKYPDRFVAAVASLPLNNVDASLRETDRAMKELKCKGIQIFSSVNGKPIDRPEFMPLYEKMAQYDLPIWLHPARDVVVPDYVDENTSKYALSTTFGWPFETTLAMSRLVFSGVMDKYPNITFIAHHCGAMIPFFYRRIPQPAPPGAKLMKPSVEYFKRFYTDTVLAGNTPALMCGHAFFGTEKITFATDYPYPGAKPDVAIDDVIKSVEQMSVPEEDKAKIFSKNAKRLLKMT